jgi:hypothetical protein
MDHGKPNDDRTDNRSRGFLHDGASLSIRIRYAIKPCRARATLLNRRQVSCSQFSLGFT